MAIRAKQHPRRRAGFTLIEIMVVIAIIGLIMTFVGKNVMTNMAEANIVATNVKITNLKSSIQEYRLKHKKVPESLRELLEPDDLHLGEPWVQNEEAIKDAWKNEFLYTKFSSRKYEIRSLGADGIEGGEFEDADISSEANSMPGG